MRISILLLFLIASLPAFADMAHYTDENGVLIIRDSEAEFPPKYRKNAYTTVKIRNNQIMVPVVLKNGNHIVETWLLLDTGANRTTISPNIAKELGVRENISVGRSTLANGSSVNAFGAIVSSLSVGSKTVHKMKIAILPGEYKEYEGLLGQDFLGRFRHNIDVKRQRINWM